MMKLFVFACLLAIVFADVEVVPASVLAASEKNENAACNVCGAASYVDIPTWCGKFTEWSQSCCECIVKHESSGNAHACNKNVGGSIDAGLWQINDMNWASCSGGSAPCDPSVNLKCAELVWRWGSKTWKFWSTAAGCGCANKP
eukprot:TRINITY_DN670_c0_g2_i1.p1 TRINITY_DN670_c0_g2~~TRINITY_DN670_c0_g2_i1.p1  ORF type:complete len:144 (-),score=18.63 TRINITY_DN670_c0_g2_i1:420-851(-)